MTADMVLINGQIVSMDEKDNEYKCIAIKNGRIVGLAHSDEMQAFMDSKTTVIDLQGKTVLPGFIDAHQHIVSFGFNLLFVDCNKLSIREVVQSIEERASTAKPNEWIIGFGFDEAKYEEKRLPNASDFAHIQNPVYITRFCLHAAVINQTVLSLAGIDADTQVPSDSEIEKDTAGHVTGVLREKAMDLVKKVLPPFTKDQIREAIALANQHYLSEGITSVHEAGMSFYTGSIDEFRALQEMSMDGSLNVRVYGMILDTFFEEAKAMRLMTGFGNDMLKIGAIKIFSDGALSGQTAAMSEDYVYPAGTRGMFMYSAAELEEKVLNAHKEGYHIAIHAIGDAAIEQVITAYEKALENYPRSDHRHRIEHCGVTTPNLIQRIKQLGLIPVPHPGIVHVAGDVYKKVLKPHVLESLYSVKTFIDEGLNPAGSSDCPVTPSSPLWGIYAAMTRKTAGGDVILPEQKITLYEGLQMYTKNAAYASFSEEEKGTLEVGKFGDLVVLPAKFMDFSAEEVQHTSVEMTIISGKVLYQRMA